MMIFICLYYVGNQYYGKLFSSCFVSFLLVVCFEWYSMSNKIVFVLGKDSMVPYVLYAYFTIPVCEILGHFSL